MKDITLIIFYILLSLFGLSAITDLTLALLYLFDVIGKQILIIGHISFCCISVITILNAIVIYNL